jgi:hypothetical protein
MIVALFLGNTLKYLELNHICHSFSNGSETHTHTHTHTHTQGGGGEKRRGERMKQMWENVNPDKS